ncbi:MAG TPA: PspC domain-containing protein [Egicoccus sp.]|nr:PspC domain-containing protein [Egicoccus sp.]HSK23267.1 PspC domain-containing protein [Egicoccus sp.]
MHRGPGGGGGPTAERRPPREKVIGGVAAALGARLGVDPVLIRIAFVVLTTAGGAGILLYGVLWAFTPLSAQPHPDGRRPATLQQATALGLITLGVLFLLRAFGLWFGDALVFPVALAAAGSAIVWTRVDDADRSRFSRVAARLPGGHLLASNSDGPASPVRLLVGTLLVAGAVAGFLAGQDSLGALRDLGFAVVAALAGLGLLFGPWLWGLLDQLGLERRERIRQEERAELAAHLHDSVLQTLALIQRSAEQPRRMVALARRQERELRSWLYGQRDTLHDQSNLTSAVEQVAEEVEAVHDLSIDVVVVGDAPLDERVMALLAAMREACVNVAKHARVTDASVYVEVEDDKVTAFVRDRGAGFDLDEVPDDRRGVRESIIGRLDRHGGHGRVVSRKGQGTEIELCVPRGRTANHQTPPAANQVRPTANQAPPAAHPASPSREQSA